MKAYVKQEGMLCYGFNIKAWIKFYENQEWDVIGKQITPDFPLPIWRIQRKSIILDVEDSDFKRYFCIKEENKNERY